ncbi:uncharacterized protein LOC110027677 [Phalaenopsis equestris]|uniref:uncharacterized protein LOC110027677 n=1 Tax=Phalaenopsis equestris TaxID=78828 RepID=UPI0009E51659|nr:uncharacterized protein LOC110027677 [Phalaenopsis equestris]
MASAAAASVRETEAGRRDRAGGGFDAGVSDGIPRHSKESSEGDEQERSCGQGGESSSVVCAGAGASSFPVERARAEKPRVGERRKMSRGFGEAEEEGAYGIEQICGFDARDRIFDLRRREEASAGIGIEGVGIGRERPRK